MSEKNVHVEHLTRVEGHGNIIMNSKNGKLETVVWEVSEAPRLFEAFVPKHTKPYAKLAEAARDAIARYRDEVSAGTFPGEEQSFR